MRDFRKERSRSHETLTFLGSAAALFLLLILLIVAGNAAWDMYVKFTVASRADGSAKQELAQLQERYDKVSAAVAGLSSARGEEEQIRERFGVARPGEGAIQIVREATTTDAGQNLNQENAFMRLLRTLFMW